MFIKFALSIKCGLCNKCVIVLGTLRAVPPPSSLFHVHPQVRPSESATAAAARLTALSVPLQRINLLTLQFANNLRNAHFGLALHNL